MGQKKGPDGGPPTDHRGNSNVVSSLSEPHHHNRNLRSPQDGRPSALRCLPFPVIESLRPHGLPNIWVARLVGDAGEFTVRDADLKSPQTFARAARRALFVFGKSMPREEWSELLWHAQNNKGGAN